MRLKQGAMILENKFDLSGNLSKAVRNEIWNLKVVDRRCNLIKAW